MVAVPDPAQRRRAVIGPVPADLPGELQRGAARVAALEAELDALNSTEQALIRELTAPLTAAERTASDRLRAWVARELAAVKARLVEHRWEDGYGRERVDRELQEQARSLRVSLASELEAARERQKGLGLLRDYPQYIYPEWDVHTAWYHAACSDGRNKRLRVLRERGGHVVPTLYTYLEHADHPVVAAVLAAHAQGEKLEVADVFVYRADHANLLTENGRREAMYWKPDDYHLLLTNGLVVPYVAELHPPQVAAAVDARLMSWAQAEAAKRSLEPQYVTKVPTPDGTLLKVDPRVEAVAAGTMPPLEVVAFLKAEGWTPRF